MNRTDHDERRFRELLDVLCDGDLPDAERDELARLAASDERRRRRAVDYLQLHVALQQELRSGQAAAKALRVIAAQETGASASQVSPLTRRIWNRLSSAGSLSLTVSAVIIGLIITAMAMMAPPFYRAVWKREAPIVAELTAVHLAQWTAGQASIAVGAEIAAGGRVQLAAGLAQLTYRDGAVVLLEGPCDYVVEGAAAGRLFAGRATARVGDSAENFRLDTPHSAIVDLGTEFGAAVDKELGTFVQVYDGVVDVRWGANRSQHHRRLATGESLEIGAAGVQSPRSATAFVRTMPGSSGENEAADAIVSNFNFAQENSCGWRTPWKVHGRGRALRSVEHPLDEGSAYMQASFERVLGCLQRTYGPCGEIDPASPHVIRWKWRFDGDMAKLTSAADRIHFFADRQEIPGSTATNSWLIGITFGVEEVRRPLVGRWYFFDSAKSGMFDVGFEARNMVDSGLALRPGTIYEFEVVVDPQQGMYSATISDGQQKFSADDLHFRNGTRGAHPVLHFGTTASAAGEDHTFSLDSIEIRSVDK